MKLLFILLVAVSSLEAVPIGIKNNNPGNVRPKTDGVFKGFPGAIGIDGNNYLIFARPIDGLRAIVINLKIYNRKRGIKTTRKIVSRWTYKKASKKIIRNYSIEMANRLRVKAWTKIKFTACNLKIITRTIVYFENGFDPYPDKLYDRIFPTCRGK